MNKYLLCLSLLILAASTSAQQDNYPKAIGNVYDDSRLSIDPSVENQLTNELLEQGKYFLSEYYGTTDFYDDNLGEYSEEKTNAFKKMFDSGSSVFYDFMLTDSRIELDEFIDGLFLYEFEGPINYDLTSINAVELLNTVEGEYKLIYNLSANVMSKLKDEEKIISTNSRNADVTLVLKAKEPNLKRLIIDNITQGHAKYKKAKPEPVEEELVIDSSNENTQIEKEEDSTESYNSSNIYEEEDVVGFSEIDYGLNLIYGTISNPNLISSSATGGGLYINRYSTFKKTNRIMWFGGLEMDYFNISSRADRLSSDISAIKIPFKETEENGQFKDGLADGVIRTGNSFANETLNLFSFSPRLGISGIIKEDRDYAHTWKVFLSGEFWLDEVLDNKLEISGSNDSGNKSEIRPNEEIDRPFPNELPSVINNNYYSSEFNVGVNPYDAGVNYAIGIGYKYQRFKDYDRGLKIGFEILYHPNFISRKDAGTSGAIEYVNQTESENLSSGGRIYNQVPILSERGGLQSIIVNDNGNVPMIELKLKVGFFKRKEKE